MGIRILNSGSNDRGVIITVEEWRWIKGYEGLYKISNFGRLRSYRKVSSGYNVSNVNQYGWYFTVSLKDKNGKTKPCRIHRLVAEAFIGEIPDGYHVHHIDGDKQNNRADNLRIVDPHEHYLCTIVEHPELCSGMNYYNQYKRPKTIYMFSMDGDYIASFPNSKCAEIVTGVCQRNILQVANGDEFAKGHTRKQAGGYVWSFEPPNSEMKEVIENAH